MTTDGKAGFWVDFRRFFVRGLATLLPTVVTIVLVFKCFEFVNQNIGVHMTEGVIRLIVFSTDNYPAVDDADITEYMKDRKAGLDASDAADRGLVKNDPGEQDKMRLWKLRRQWNSGPLSLIGFSLAIVHVYILGRLLASFLGRKVWAAFEGTVQQLPVFKQVYPYLKQVTDFLFGENKIEFSRVVAIQYPRNGIWSIGLVTGAGFRRVSDAAKQDFLTVFVPSSPTPMTGYVVYVRKDEVLDLPITIEEALRFSVSGGVIVPDHQALPTQMAELKSDAGNDEAEPSVR